MAASPVSIVTAPGSTFRRRPLALTPRRLEANRRNAARSTGPRTLEGKARVARNPIKHGFFVAPDRWTSEQHRDFDDTLDGLRENLKPQGAMEESCVVTMARSYVRMAALLRYENITALQHHQHRERELNERIEAAAAPEAARLKASREELRRAGLWRPTIPGPREAMAIIRYEGSLIRTIRSATAELEGLKGVRLGRASSISKSQKQTHFEASPSRGPHASHEHPGPVSAYPKVQKQTHYTAATPQAENAKANPLSSMFTGNRHERRRAKALAARHRWSP